jgi:colicin import membrane protein
MAYDVQKLLDKNTSYSEYDYSGAQQAMGSINRILSTSSAIPMSERKRLVNDLNTIQSNYNRNISLLKQAEVDKKRQIEEQQKQIAAEEARLAAEEKRIADLEAKKKAEQAAAQKAAAAAKAEREKAISLLGQEDIQGVAKEFGTVDLEVAKEIKAQRDENIQKQAEADAISESAVRMSRAQRGRRGTATSTSGGRGFFERYFQ